MFIPPWLNPPDPVSTYQRGVQIGAQIGEQQATQRLRQQQLEQEATAQAVRAAREQQEMEMTNAYRQAKLGMEAAETGRRVQARMKYDALVKSGMSPLQAFMSTSEAWGESTAGIPGALERMERQKQLDQWQPSVRTLPDGTKMGEVAPGRFQIIKPPLSVRAEDVQVRDIPGTKSKMVFVPGQGMHIVKSEEEKAESTEVSILKTELLSIGRQLRADPSNPEFQQQYDAIVDQLQEYNVHVPRFKPPVAGGPTASQSELPAMTIPKIKNWKVTP